MKATAEYVSTNELHRRDADGNPISKIQDVPLVVTFITRENSFCVQQLNLLLFQIM